LRKPADHRWHWRSRRKLRDQLFDLALRSAGGLSQHLAVFLLRQVRAQQPKAGQMYLPRAQGLDDGGESPSCMRHGDPAVGLVLREPELTHAEREHRGGSHLQVQAPLLDLGEMNQYVSLDDATAPEDLARRGEKFFIAKGSDVWIGVDHESIRTIEVFAPRRSTAYAFSAHCPRIGLVSAAHAP